MNAGQRASVFMFRVSSGTEALVHAEKVSLHARTPDVQ